MQGKIIRSLSGFYEVHTGTEQYRCRAKGVFRSMGVKPLVGDDVLFDATDLVSEPKEGNVTRILPRRNQLLRPSVANVDQALLVFAVTRPAPSCNMLDRFLIAMQEAALPAVLCFNKADLAGEAERDELRDIYEHCGASVIFMSTRDPADVDRLREKLAGKTTVFTGPSGVGKSTLINLLCPDARMETGELARKIQRGKNTTRHVEIFSAGDGAYVCDTPGFTSLFLEGIGAEQLRDCYPEFEGPAAQCRFHGCRHLEEPGCAVRRSVEEGAISRIRYGNYRELYEELKNRKPIYRKEASR